MPRAIQCGSVKQKKVTALFDVNRKFQVVREFEEKKKEEKETARACIKEWSVIARTGVQVSRLAGKQSRKISLFFQAGVYGAKQNQNGQRKIRGVVEGRFHLHL